MLCRALIVPRARGESVRRLLAEQGLLRTDLEICEEGSFLLLPLVGDSVIPEGLGNEELREFPPRGTVEAARYQDLLDWPAELKAAVPRAFDVIGDIVLVRIPPELASRSSEIGDALLRFVPGARIVGSDHGVQGTERRRRVERIAGTGGWSTRHRENGVELDVDVERAYFSPRLGREHAAVADQVAVGEIVLDLCCGVGPFAVTIARQGRASQIIAVDINPEAISLLRSTLDRLALTGRVRAQVADVATFVGSAPPADRVILNLPREGIKYAPLVARAVAPAGQFHYYEVVPRDEAERRGRTVAALLPPEGAFACEESHTVHAYSPGADLVEFRFRRRAD